VSVDTCAECGTELAGRADAVYCCSACRQRAYRRRNRDDLSRPVPVGDKDMFRDRFRGYTGSDDRDEPINPILENILENFVLGVASIGRSGRVRGERFLDVDAPLEEALPEAVTPEYADFLVEFLAPALDRAHELLELLIRRSREQDTQS
jgi:hypothetical protein